MNPAPTTTLQPHRDLPADFRALTTWGQRQNAILDEPILHSSKGDERASATKFYLIGFALIVILGVPMSLIQGEGAKRTFFAGIVIIAVLMLFFSKLAWYSDWGTALKVSWIRRRIAEIDHAHFDLLIHELAGHTNLEFAAFVCHMLGYFCFVPRELLNDHADNSPLPVDAHWWNQPADADVELTLLAILQTPVMHAVPADQYWGVLAHVRRTAQVTLKRWREEPVAAKPSRGELQRMSSRIEAAAQRNEGPRLEIGIMMRKYVATRD